jgi:hypothetical protein
MSEEPTREEMILALYEVDSKNRVDAGNPVLPFYEFERAIQQQDLVRACRAARIEFDTMKFQHAPPGNPYRRAFMVAWRVVPEEEEE